MNNYLEKLFSNIVISAFLPAFAFVCTTFFLFYDLIPTSIREKAKIIYADPIYWIIGFTVILGFITLYGRELIISLYRGSCFRQPHKFREKILAEKIWQEIQGIESKMSSMKRGNKGGEFQRLDITRREKINTYCSDFPPDITQISITRLGNIWRAMEYYPADRYGILSPTIWHRLRQVIPPEKLRPIDDAFNELMFFINLSFFSYLTSILGLLAIICSSAVCLIFNADCNLVASDWLDRFHLLFVSIVLSAILGFLFYKVSLPIARYYANIHKGAFDLYRFLLLESLKQEIPSNIFEEIDKWEALSELIDMGGRGYLTRNDGIPLIIQYNNTNSQIEALAETPEDDPQ